MCIQELCLTWARLPFFAAIAVGVSACWPASLRGPDRLYPVPQEMGAITTSESDLVKAYWFAFYAGDTPSLAQAKAIRNEIIAARMYAIDLQYSEYEGALTRERQEVGFATLTTSEGLNVAGTLVGGAATKGILSGVAGFVTAEKGHYESEILLAKTVDIIEKQMRASRHDTATLITQMRQKTVIDYPLSAAFSDLEDYYRAGTLISGIIGASNTVGAEEQKTKDAQQTAALKPVTTVYVEDDATKWINDYTRPGGVFDKKLASDLQTILKDDLKSNEPLWRILYGEYGTKLRRQLVAAAKQKGLKPK